MLCTSREHAKIGHFRSPSRYVLSTCVFLKGWINIKVSGAATSRTNNGPSTCQSRKISHSLYSDHSGSESHVRRGFCLYISRSHTCQRIAYYPSISHPPNSQFHCPKHRNHQWSRKVSSPSLGTPVAWWRSKCNGI